MKAELIGSDIEFAVRDRKTGLIVPAGLLPIKGRKGKAEPMNYGGVEIDCCGVEITPKPAANADDFVNNILRLTEEVQTKFSDYEFLDMPSHNFTTTQLESAPEATVMGCDPDYDAWYNTRNPTPNAVLAGIPNLRSFGGHVHIEGGTPATIVACDALLGLWSSEKDRDRNRRLLYGKAGAFRTKPYGVEYRVLSNFWTMNEDHLRTVFKYADIARKMTIPAIKGMLNTMGVADKNYWGYIRNCINNGNVADSKVYHSRALAYLKTTPYGKT